MLLQHAHPMATRITKFSSNDISRYQEMMRIVNTAVPWHIIQTDQEKKQERERKKERKRKRNAKEKKSSDMVKDDGTSLKYTLRVRYYHKLRIKQV